MHFPYTAEFLFAQQAEPPKNLPEPVRQIALMAILGIALCGMLLIVITLLGGHWVRRWGDQRRGPVVPPDLIMPRRSPTQSTQPPGDTTSPGDDQSSIRDAETN